MNSVEEDHGSFPVPPTLLATFRVYSNAVVSDKIISDIAYAAGDRQSFKEIKCKFWCIQAGLARGSAFLKTLASLKATAQVAYDAEIRRLNELKAYVNPWMTALATQSGVNKAKRREDATVSQEKILRARVTCSKRGCYGEMFKDAVCYHHYVLAHPEHDEQGASGA